ncbi:hypothetical protein JCM10207_002701 [Rhodosporidiobolus poonsookiae]
MATTYYDLDGDGLYDTALSDPYLSGGGYGLEGGYLDDYSLSHGYGGGLDHYHGYDYDAGYGGYADPWLAYESEYAAGHYADPLYSYMDYVPETWGGTLYDAWRDDSWAEEQHYQHQLDLDTALSTEERLARWESRLAWEELDDAARAARYRELLRSDPYTLRSLGLYDGFWGRRFGGREVDLSYLREVPLGRGLFAAPYRERFVRHPTLGRRYSPYFSRSRLRAFAGPGVDRPIQPYPAAPYASRRIGTDGAMSLRARELVGRLRVAEMRAGLTSLSPAQRAQALSDARRLRALLNAEQRTARELDRSERAQDAALAAREAEAEALEAREEREELRRIGRVEEAVAGLGVGAGRGMGGYGGSYGYY